MQYDYITIGYSYFAMWYDYSPACKAWTGLKRERERDTHTHTHTHTHTEQ